MLTSSMQMRKYNTIQEEESGDELEEEEKRGDELEDPVSIPIFTIVMV